jgi:sensor domain CHASE-containing protein
MSLRNKIVLILLVVVALNGAFDYVGQRSVVGRSFEHLESDEAHQDLRRAAAAVDVEVEALGRQARRWAVWDDSYRFVKHPTPDFIASNLGENALADEQLDLLYLCDATGKVVWGRTEHPSTREPLQLRDFPSGSLARNGLLTLPREDGLISGLLSTERGPMLVASHPILDSAGLGEDRDGDGQLEPRGTVVVGRFFDAARVQALGERFHVAFDLWTVDDEALPARERELRDEITGAVLPVTDEVDEDTLHIYETLADIRRNPTMILRARVPRDIRAEGARALNYSVMSSLVTVFLILMVLLRLLQHTVVAPITRLTKTTVEVGRTDDTSMRVGMDRNDEIGTLSNEFDGMLEKLASSRQQLVQTARKVGMSEIATGVLHNVGNVLNSVNVSANMLAKKAENLPVGDLNAAVGVLESQGDDLGRFVTEDPRGKNLVPFLAEIRTALHAQRQGLQDELKVLGKGLDHVMELVRSQQTYAGQSGVFEMLSATDLLESALTICTQAYGSTDEMEVVREYEELPNIPLDRSKTTEILVNLIHNARQAMADQEARRLTLRVKSDAGERVRIEVQDTGCGVTPENLAKIFAHGFTTKSDGHGFGLHVSANAATEMKGRLFATSDGPGHGATFVLELPLEQRRSSRTAA